MSGDDPAAIQGFIEDRPDRERALEEVLAVDAEQDTWTFDDVNVDSGTFGEMVSRGFVEKIDGEYQLAAPDVVEEVLTGEDVAIEGESGDGLLEASDVNLGTFGDRSALAGLLGALGLLFVTRILNYRSVFQQGYVVSPGNDPYHYRYWMEQLLEESSGPTDVGLITNLPDGAASRRPLTHVTNWFVAELLGGDQWAADMVAAWLPVVGALALGVVIYMLAVVVTRDVRVGLAALVLFAFTPVHAVYSGVGFIEHRLHQYFWMGVGLLALAWLAVDLTRNRAREASIEEAVQAHLSRPLTWAVAVVLGASLGLYAHTWGGSILLFIPVSGYVTLKVVMDVRDGVPPILANAPLVAGIGVGGVLAAFLHFRLAWHETFMGVVPLLVLVGSVGVVGLGELWRRTGWSIHALIGTQAAVGFVGLVGFRAVRPGEWSRLMDRADDLLFREGAVETKSLFEPELAYLIGPVAQIGVEFYIGLVFLGWAGWIVAREYQPVWLLLSVYSVFWLLMAAFQGRFAAQLAISMTVFAGLGFVYLLSWVELARVPAIFDEGVRGGLAMADGGERGWTDLQVPGETKTLVYVLGIGFLVCGLSLIFVPSLAAQTTYSETQLEAALSMEEHAQEHDREWRDNAVFSGWSDNRMYNYFVSGEANRYPFVRSMYPDFITDDDADEWKDRLDGRFGYVVTNEENGMSPHRLGAGGEQSLEHYQLLYLSEDENIAAFAIVEGATITGQCESHGAETIKTEVEVRGDAFKYERDFEIENGKFEVTVPYPGNYTICNERIEITPTEVEQGMTQQINQD